MNRLKHDGGYSRRALSNILKLQLYQETCLESCLDVLRYHSTKIGYISELARPGC